MDVMQKQIDDYKNRDIDKLLECYAEEAVIENGNGDVMMTGRDAIRSVYGPFFEASPDLHAEVLNEIRIGQFIVLEEKFSGANIDGEVQELHGGSLNRIVDDRITYVRLLEG